MGGIKNMDNKISIIVPAYNVDKYIKACVESILKQTYQNLEIILIDDGSKDKTLDICLSFQESDPRVHVIHQAYGGPSRARNTGIEHSTGDYICFVDADDWIHEDYCRILYETIKLSDSQIVMCGYKKVLSEIKDDVISQANPHIMDRKEAFSWLTDRDSDQYVSMVVVWNKIYKRELFKQVRFAEGKFHEDEFIVHEILNQIHQMVVIDTQLYYYRQRRDSIMGIDNLMNPKHLEALEAYEMRIKMFEKNGERDLLEVAWRNYMLSIAEDYLLYRNHTYVGKEEIMKNLKQTYKKSFFNYFRVISGKKKIKYIIFLINPSSFGRIFHLRYS